MRLGGAEIPAVEHVNHLPLEIKGPELNDLVVSRSSTTCRVRINGAGTKNEMGEGSKVIFETKKYQN